MKTVNQIREMNQLEKNRFFYYGSGTYPNIKITLKSLLITHLSLTF